MYRCNDSVWMKYVNCIKKYKLWPLKNYLLGTLGILYTEIQRLDWIIVMFHSLYITYYTYNICSQNSKYSEKSEIYKNKL